MDNHNFRIPKMDAFLGTIFVNNTMVSHIWIVAILLFFIMLLVWAKAPEWLLAIFVFMLFLVLVLYACTYIFFMKNNPKMLLSEKTFLSVYRYESLGVKNREKSIEVIEAEQPVTKKNKLLPGKQE